MKISINSKFFQGPYGGGMQFANYFKGFLEGKGIKVVNNLKDHDIDVIFHVNPFSFLRKSASYSFLDAYAYKLEHPKTIIIQRINECDERKGTKYVNKLLIEASKYSDAIIFIASWLKPLLEKAGLNKEKKSTIILHGSDNRIFNTDNKEFWDKKRKMRIVTHHWGGHYLKGHDFYKRLDNLLNKKEFFDKFEFTYIGNYPKDLIYKNTKIISPLAGKELVAELKKHDVYITASRNEPAGMHHVEGALCGLPLLYIDSGSLSEYCRDYGLEFDKDNFEKKLLEMYYNYDIYLEKIKRYDRTADKMSEKYLQFINETYKEKEKFEIKDTSKIKILLFKLYLKFYHGFWIIRKVFW